MGNQKYRTESYDDGGDGGFELSKMERGILMGSEKEKNRMST